MKAYRLTPDGIRNEVVPYPRDGKASPETFTLRELQDLVGGYIEVIYLTDEVVMIVDEDGKMKGEYVNPEATKMFIKCKEVTDFIVGTVVVCEASMLPE